MDPLFPFSTGRTGRVYELFGSDPHPTPEPEHVDPFILVELADESWKAGRVDQCEALIEAAFEGFDRAMGTSASESFEESAGSDPKGLRERE
jgi:hypothetical protein